MVHVVEASPSNRGKWPQHLAACLAAIAIVSGGTLEGWTSPALPYLQENQSTNASFESEKNFITLNETTVARAINDDEASWIGSLAAVGALLGALPSGPLADKFGRRVVLLGLTLPYIVGWVMIILAEKSVILLYAARFIMGLAAGASMVAVSLYNEEIAETNLRGELGSYLDLAITVGILYVYAIGAFVPYTWLCISGAIVPVLFAITFFWMPESPVFLLSKGRKVEAEKSLRWLRNVGKLDSPEIHMELIEMEGSVKKPSATCEQCNTSRFVALKRCLSTISYSSPTCKTIVLVIGLMLGQQLSGINAVIFYTVDIFQAAGSTLSPYYCTLIVGVVQVISTYIAALLMDRLGRRFLLLASGCGMAASLLVLTVFFHFKENGDDVSDWNWIPLASLNIYIIAFCIGFGPIPWFMVVELSTNETKGWMSSMGVSVNWLMVFAMTKAFILMLKSLGQAVTYGILCVLCAFAAIFVLICVPETKGKTREEIQAALRGN